MINYNYTTGNAFNYNGAPYKGYYNIQQKTAYTGKEYTSTSVVLEPQANIMGEFLVNGNLFNYNPNIGIVLPYKESDILFSSNEIVNSLSINLKIKMLTDNFYELYKACMITPNDIPNGYTGYASLTSSTTTLLNWRQSSITASFSLSTINTSLTGIDGILIAQSKNSGDVNIFATTLSSYFIFKFDQNLSTFTFVGSSSTPDIKSEILYSNISQISYDNIGFIYVADTNNNQVYKVDINSTINNSRVNLNNPKLILTLNDVNKPTVIKYTNSGICIYDSNTYSIIRYNDKFTKINNYTNKKFFESNIPCDIIEIGDNLLILTKTGKLLTISNALVGETTIQDLQINTVSEHAKFLRISKNNSGICYVCTNRNIYKYFLYDKIQKIGTFNLSNINVIATNLSFDILGSNENYDTLIVFEKDKFLLFKENNNLLSILSNVSFNVDTVESILLKDEFFNNITINNALYKIIYNHTILLSFLQTNAAYRYINQELLFDSLRVIQPELINAINSIDENNFVGVNENVIPQVFNRVFGLMFKFQQKIADVIKPAVLNDKYQITQHVTF